MELHEYPRPKGDTGIGVHWSGGSVGAVGIGELRDVWLPRLLQMGVKWVKILHDGGVEFAQMLLENDIMPIVRLYRHAPNSTDPAKGVLTQREIDYLDRYVAVGVRYFEFNNEPSLPHEWEEGYVPPNAIEIVARNAIRDMRTILDHGGYPAVPATAIGVRWDLIGEIIKQGGRSLFDEPVWLAVHNYDINHPLDYPYDDVNQKGTLLTREEYDRLGRASWEGNHGFRSFEYVNEQRRIGMNPGDTIMDDASCWLAYERLAQLCYQHLGRYLPILATENGPIVGEDDDPRYPTTTPERHRDKVLEMCRIMMGTSERFDPAPDYFFCTAFWLMGNAMLRVSGPWEKAAWYSTRWEGHKLPVVDALMALPKRARPLVSPTTARISGRARGGANALIMLTGEGETFSAQADAEGRFTFHGVQPGRYLLTVANCDARQTIEVSAGQVLTVELDLTPYLITWRPGRVRQPAMQDLHLCLPSHPTMRYLDRPRDQIRRLIVHHTGRQTTPQAAARWQVEHLGRPGLAHHFMVAQDGTITLCQPPEAITPHTARHNEDSLSVCFIGNFIQKPAPEAAQLNAAAHLCAFLLDQFELGLEAIIGRREVEEVPSPGTQWDSGVNWKATLLAKVRAYLPYLVDEETQRRMTAVEEALTKLKAQLERLIAEPDGEFARLEAQLDALQRQLEDIERRLLGRA